MPLGACSRSRAGTSPTQIHSQHRHLIHRPRHARRRTAPMTEQPPSSKAIRPPASPSPRPEDRRAGCAGPASDASRHRPPPDRGRQSRRTVTSFTMSNNRTRQSAGSNLSTAKEQNRATPRPPAIGHHCFLLDPSEPASPAAPSSAWRPSSAWCPSSSSAWWR